MANLTYKQLQEQVWYFRLYGYLPATTKRSQKREVLEQLLAECIENRKEEIAKLEKTVSESVAYIEMNWHWHKGVQTIPEGTRFYSWADLHNALKEIADANPLKNDRTYTWVQVMLHKKDGVTCRVHRFYLSLLDTNPYEAEDVVLKDIPEYEESLKVNHSNVLKFPEVKDTKDTGRNQLQENHQNCVAVFREFNINPDEGAEIIAKSEITSSEVYNIAENTTQNLQDNALEMALYGEWVNKMITSGLTSQIVSYDIWLSIRAL